MSPEATYILESLGTIAAFGGALYLATRAMRRLGVRARGPIDVLARQSLDARRAIYLVRVGKRVLIVGASEGGMSRLGSTSLEAIRDELPVPSEPERNSGEPDARGTFRDVLARALGRKQQ